jgi:Predicted membrane protein (DUF2142)
MICGRPGSSTRDAAVEQTPRHSLRRSLTFSVWAFAALALSIGAWSVSTPLGAAPDEPSHMIDAAAVVRGQFDTREVPLYIGLVPVGRISVVHVPDWVANTKPLAACFEGRPSVPASCSPSVGTDTREVEARSQFSNYPPLYYLVVGVPTLISVGSGALYAMRYTGALLDAALIALGLFLLARYHPRRLTLLGAMIALSPMVLFVSSVVNSSGLETAAAFASWCGGLCVVERADVPRGLAALTSLSLVLLILSRPISPVNAAVIVVVLGASVGWRRVRVVLGQKSVTPIWLSALIAVALAGLFLVFVGLPSLLGVPEKPRLSVLGAVWLTLRLSGHRLRQCIGDFGWLDTPAPLMVIVVWTAVLAGLLVFSLAMSQRARRALPLLAVAVLAMPVVFESPQINAVGPYWQGRYWLPLVVGLPLVASSVLRRSISRHGRSRGVSPVVALTGFVALGLLLGSAQLVAFLTALRRYETGLGVKAAAVASWMPPGGTDLVVILFVAGQALLIGLLSYKYFDDKRSSTDLSLALPTRSAPLGR